MVELTGARYDWVRPTVIRQFEEGISNVLQVWAGYFIL